LLSGASAHHFERLRACRDDIDAFIVVDEQEMVDEMSKIED
jgi:hypothetical protein